MSNAFQNLTQQDLEEGKRFLMMYSQLQKMERMQAMIYIHALSDRNKIAQGIVVSEQDAKEGEKEVV